MLFATKTLILDNENLGYMLEKNNGALDYDPGRIVLYYIGHVWYVIVPTRS